MNVKDGMVCAGWHAIPPFQFLFNLMNRIRVIGLAGLIASALTGRADLVAHFDMEVSNGKITESVSGEKFDVLGHFVPENVDGAVGKALRFDGYTSHVDARLGNILSEGSKKMTVSLWMALPCYPIIQLDTDTKEQTPVVSCLDTDKKTGFGFFLGFNGKYSFRTYIGGWPATVEVDTPLSPYEWHNLVAVVDCEGGSIKLYDNGEEVGSGRVTGAMSMGELPLYMGQGTVSRKLGPFELMSYNGLIDDISVWNEAKPASEIATWKTTEIPNLDIPASRFAEDKLRPRFHGMPAAGWTNECHGMYYSDGRYHLFFQKNGDGPYMARLHWGHISSENLYDWREEKIAIAPGDWYNIKGCWSGCVFADDEITGGKPNILYTAVDYAKAMIAQASPESESLETWIESAKNPIIPGRPSGLSDDFRDPYFFRHNGNAYIIVGSSKNGVGVSTLHRYNSQTGTWSNNGDLFYEGKNASVDGVFWEMANITPMPNGKWLFTATPLGTSQGVRTIYWTGNISEEGKFLPDANSASPRLVEMNSKEGFGLLSPTIYQHDGKTIVLGIVPDKLPQSSNWNLGWAHCYSLPREWSLDESGTLIQRPFAGLTGMRTDKAYENHDFELSGVQSLTPVSGRAVEVLSTFEVGNSVFGFNIFKSAGSQATVSYDPSTGVLTADFSSLRRLTNDGGVYDGVYTCALPEKPAVGSEMKINMFIDHSILDIFVNDKWATSIRVFPTEADADGIEVFAGSTVKMHDLSAWVLDPSAGESGLTSLKPDCSESVDVISLSGLEVHKNVARNEALQNLPAGLYLVGGEKVMVK